MTFLPWVTCGLTLFNCQSTIEKAIKSCMSQDYPNKLILLVDDCSEDNTVAVAQSVLSNSSIPHKLIRLNANFGVAYARNILIDNCSTEFIAFFDDDDVSLPSRISSQLNYLRINTPGSGVNYTDDALCYTDRVFISSDKSSIIHSMNAKLSHVQAQSVINALLSAEPLPTSCIPGSTATCTLCARTATLKRIGMFDPKFRRYEDLELAIKALLHGISLVSVPQILVKQFFTNTSDKFFAYQYNLLLIKKYRHLFCSKKDFLYAYFYVRLKNKILYSSKDSFLYIFLMLITHFPFKFMKHLLNLFRYRLSKLTPSP